jgi:hypothetical protein
LDSNLISGKATEKIEAAILSSARTSSISFDIFSNCVSSYFTCYAREVYDIPIKCIYSPISSNALPLEAA